jgi:hypothetical protein
MKRGYFKDRTFNTLQEYEQALKESAPDRRVRRHNRKRVVSEHDRFHLTVTLGGVTYEVYGPLQTGREVDTLLDAITEATKGLTH